MQQVFKWKGWFGKVAAHLAYRLLGMKTLANWNTEYKEGMSLPDFVDGIFRQHDVRFEFPEDQLSRIPATGAFITVSNHHYGLLDGMVLYRMVMMVRPDFQALTSTMLSLIPCFKDNAIFVDNVSGNGSAAATLKGFRQAYAYLQEGHGLGLFPAGEVATWQKEGRKTAVEPGRIVEDIPWPDSMCKFIRNAHVPVVPIYFDGGNTNRFHRLGRIHRLLRTFRLVWEAEAKRHSVIKVRIGKPIMPADMDAFADARSLGDYLRNRVYAMESAFVPEKPERSTGPLEPIAAPANPAEVKAEVESLASKRLFSVEDYDCYLTKAEGIPNLMHEVARLREETFRAVGEGTGLPLDTDVFDQSMHHLILWNRTDGELAGAYRIGICSEMMKEKGAEALYSNTLVKYAQDQLSFLNQCVELGRSFVVAKYQRQVLPLKLLFSGLLQVPVLFKQVKYYLGLVSISEWYPDFYQSLIVDFLLKFAAWDKHLATPTHPFKPHFLRVNPDQLYAGCKGSPTSFDRLLSTMSDGRYRMPVLVRQYLGLGARLACFNVDPDFNNSLDGLIVAPVQGIPDEMLDSLTSFLPEEQRAATRACARGV